MSTSTQAGRPRAPFPRKPQSEVVARLRRALRDVWSDVELGEFARAAEQLEAEVVFAICDLESWTVEGWEQARDELEAARPAGGWRLEGRSAVMSDETIGEDLQDNEGVAWGRLGADRHARSDQSFSFRVDPGQASGRD